MAKESLGQRLARLRKEKAYTQNDIADKLGVTAQAVSKWENDQASPDVDLLIKLSDMYEISLDELLGKEKKTVTMNEKPTKKDLDDMFLRVRIDDDGDQVNVNLPLALVRAFVDKDTGKLSMVSGNEKLEGIDFRKIIELVEQGVLGEIVSIKSKDGGTVSVIVE